VSGSIPVASEPVQSAGVLPPPSARARGRHRRTIIAIVIVVIVVVAGVATYEAYEVTHTSGPAYPTPPAGWVTFRTAWSDVSQAFSGLASGPWSIYFAEGAAADGPWSPPAALWAAFPPAFWEGCFGTLSGVSTMTFWNSSLYPHSDSTNVFSSGAAPLWTFAFNGTGTSMFVASWLEGHVIVNAAAAPDSSCFNFFKFDIQQNSLVNPSRELDSNAIASEAAGLADSSFPSSPGSPSVPQPSQKAFALYFPGQELFLPATTTGFQWTLAYGNCGLDGQLGSIFNFEAYLFNGTQTVNGFGIMTTEESCFDSYYLLNMSQVAVQAPPNASGRFAEWNLTWGFVSSAVPATWSESDLSTSMIHWQLKNWSTPPFANYPPTAAICGPTEPNVSACTPPTQGWYAVLLNQSGHWLDSYPSTQNGTAWTIPNVVLIPGDRILFVAAAGTPLTPSAVYFETTDSGEPTVFGSDAPLP
jgi:hypothetical protein